MLQRVIDTGLPAGWLTADEVYGQGKRLRVWCEQRGLPYVLATRTNDTLATVDWRQRRGRIAQADRLLLRRWLETSVDGAPAAFAVEACTVL